MKKLIAGALLVASFSANAEFLYGNKMLSMMNGSESEKSFIMGYIAGAADSAMGTRFCPKGEVTVGQIHDIVKEFLVKYPQHRNETADTIVIATISTLMPCKEKSPGRPIGRSI